MRPVRIWTGALIRSWMGHDKKGGHHERRRFRCAHCHGGSAAGILGGTDCGPAGTASGSDAGPGRSRAPATPGSTGPAGERPARSSQHLPGAHRLPRAAAGTSRRRRGTSSRSGPSSGSESGISRRCAPGEPSAADRGRSPVSIDGSADAAAVRAGGADTVGHQRSHPASQHSGYQRAAGGRSEPCGDAAATSPAGRRARTGGARHSGGA